MKKLPVLAALCALSLLASGCGNKNSDQSAHSDGEQNLKVWIFGALEDNTWIPKLVDQFEADHPGVTVEVQGQPGDNYYAMLQAQLSAGDGPDIYTMFAGGYISQFEDYSLDLAGLIPTADLDSVQAQYYSTSGGTASSVFGVPVTAGMYQMFYNKAVLEQAGVSQFPTTWDELYAACAKVVTQDKTCLGYGSATGSGSFPAIYDWSYLASVFSLTQWDQLTDGTLPYDSPELVDQVTKWATLHEKGYTNEDVMTWRDVRPEFLAGNIAMIMGGSWDASWIKEGLGDDAGTAPAPFSTKPMETLIQVPDTGFSISRDSKKADLAVDFVKFTISEEGQKIIAEADQIPSREGVAVQSNLNNDLLEKAATKGWERKPMFDNFIVPAVTDTLGKSLNQAMAGQITPSEALSQIDTTVASLPETDRVNHNLGGTE